MEEEDLLPEGGGPLLPEVEALLEEERLLRVGEEGLLPFSFSNSPGRRSSSLSWELWRYFGAVNSSLLHEIPLRI